MNLARARSDAVDGVEMHEVCLAQEGYSPRPVLVPVDVPSVGPLPEWRSGMCWS